MGNIINLDDYRKGEMYEKEYQEFLSHTETPKNYLDVFKAFYFSLRYLEGNINALSILSVLQQAPYEEITQLKEHVLQYLNELQEQLKNL